MRTAPTPEKNSAAKSCGGTGETAIWRGLLEVTAVQQSARSSGEIRRGSDLHGRLDAAATASGCETASEGSLSRLASLPHETSRASGTCRRATHVLRA